MKFPLITFNFNETIVLKDSVYKLKTLQKQFTDKSKFWSLYMHCEVQCTTKSCDPASQVYNTTEIDNYFLSTIPCELLRL